MKQWETNSSIRKILALNWLDVDVLLVNVIGNTVFLKGTIRFHGRLIREDDEPAVNEHLNKVEGLIFETPGLEFIKWDAGNWAKSGEKWKRIINTPAV
jgi:hypothetical protein